jgi:hypothetical protein
MASHLALPRVSSAAHPISACCRCRGAGAAHPISGARIGRRMTRWSKHTMWRPSLWKLPVHRQGQSACAMPSLNLVPDAQWRAGRYVLRARPLSWFLPPAGC